MHTITTTNLNEARKQIQKLLKEQKEGKIKSEEKIAILSQDDEFNRKALEIKGINMLIINEALEIKDYMKQRNSGLNEVVANICTEKNIELGIQLDEIIKKNDVEKAKALSRLIQNTMLCKKAGAKLVFLTNSKDKLALQAILLSLGASTKQAQQATF